MKIGEHNIDMEKVANDVALLYAKESLKDNFVPNPNTVTSMVQAYLNAYTLIGSMNEEELKSLLRW